MRAAAKAAAGASIATWLLAIILIVLLGSSASNVKVYSDGINVKFDPVEQKVILSMKTAVINNGFLDLTNVSLRVGVISSRGNILAEYSESADVIPAGFFKTFNIILKMDANSVYGALLSGETLLVACRADVGVAGLIRASAYTVAGLRLEAGEIGVKS